MFWFRFWELLAIHYKGTSICNETTEQVYDSHKNIFDKKCGNYRGLNREKETKEVRFYESKF